MITPAHLFVRFNPQSNQPSMTLARHDAEQMATTTLTATRYLDEPLKKDRAKLSTYFLRIGRACLWPHPHLYRPIGALRKRPAVPKDIDLWVAGFPRSGNTFLWKYLELAFPTKKVAGHLHLPPMVIAQLERGSSGILVLRTPRDAVISWSIFLNVPLAYAIDYYIDFHRILARYRTKMFVARFEDVTRDPQSVIDRFCARFDLAPIKSLPGDQRNTKVFELIDRMTNWTRPDGSVDEMKVARPSEKRHFVAERLALQIERSPELQQKLEAAEKLYQEFNVLAR